MFDLHQTSHLWLYFLLVAGIIVLPGMDMAFVMAASLVDGRRAGLTAVAGIVAGGMIHILMSGVGIGLLLMSAPRLFNALLVAGALYVAWIGVALMRGATALGETGPQASRPLPAIFRRAVMTCLLNPKAYVFMLAVFPQFLRTEYGSVAAQAVVLGGITSLTQGAVYGSVAIGAARARGWLRGNARMQVRLGRGVGCLLLGVAVWTALQGWRLG